MPIQISSIDLRALRESAARRSFSAAAKPLEMSAQGVAKRIKRLEALAGVALFKRLPSGVELTPAGRQVDTAARAALVELDHVERVIKRLAGGRAQVSIAVSPTLADSFLVPALWQFDHRTGQATGRVAIGMTMANSSDVRDDVRHGRVDVGIAAREAGAEPADLEERFLVDDEVVVAVGPDHSWLERQKDGRGVLIDTVAHTPMATRDAGSNVRQVFEKELRDRGLELAEPLAEMGAARLVIDFALEENCPALLSRVALRGNNEMKVIDMSERTASARRPIHVPRKFVITYRDWDLLSPEAQALVDFLVEAAAAVFRPEADRGSVAPPS